MSESTAPAGQLQESVLVVAHPDDEILWFGSVAADVRQIVICFLNDPLKPEMARARKGALADHPWKEKILCLGLDETGSFGRANWPRPDTTEFGLRIVKGRQIADAYRLCYGRLEEMLAPIVRNATSVITHNPWGEYGHEEHVLVHRAATTVAETARKEVWYNNHVSTWSEDLMRVYMDKSERPVIGREVDVPSMENIAAVYREHGAWTWLDDFRWFREECLIRGPLARTDRPGFGWLCPMNLLRLPERDEPGSREPRSRIERIVSRLTRSRNG